MNYEDFCNIVSEISKIPLGKINKDSSFRDDLDIDSLQMLNLILELTSRFGIEKFKIQGTDDLETVWKMYQTLTREGTEG